MMHSPRQHIRPAEQTDEIILAAYRERRLAVLESFARLLDDRFCIPGTGIHFGLDPVLGLFPGVGDSIGTVLSSIIVLQLARMGAPKSVLVRMVANVFVDTVISFVPLVGDAFDVKLKVNIRNTNLARAIPAEKWRHPRDNRAIVGLTVGALLLIFVLAIVAAVVIVRFVVRIVG